MTAGAQAAAKKVTLTFLIDNQSALDGIKAVTAAAEKKLNISITIDLRPGGAEGDNVVKTRLATGDMDDLSYYNSGSLFQALNPPQNFVDLTDEPYMSTVLDSFKSTVSVDGRVYGIPAAYGHGRRMAVQQEGLRAARPEGSHDVGRAPGQLRQDQGCRKDRGHRLLQGRLDVPAHLPGRLLQRAGEDPTFAADYTAHKATIAGTPMALRSFEKLQEI